MKWDHKNFRVIYQISNENFYGKCHLAIKNKNIQMKNTLIIIGLFVVLLAAVSCNKEVLDTQPTDKYNEGNFWESEQAVAAALSGCYNPLTMDGLFGGEATPL